VLSGPCGGHALRFRVSLKDFGFLDSADHDLHIDPDFSFIEERRVENVSNRDWVVDGD